jgi:hypothetical protein
VLRATDAARISRLLVLGARLGGLAAGAREQHALYELAVEKESTFADAHAGDLASFCGGPQVRHGDSQ